MTSEKTARRRRYGEEIKAQVLSECDMPGASVAKVAMSHGINANIVHRWRQLAREGAQGTVARSREFVPVSVASLAAPVTDGRGDIEIELRRGAVTMKLSWPVAAAAEFAAWTRELLR
jgi:transposase